MIKRIYCFFLTACAALLLLPAVGTSAAANKADSIKQPVAPVKPVTTDYYGTKVVDPYRYMENLEDPEVQAWMKGQNAYARAELAKIPGREALLEKIRRYDQSVPRVRVRRLPGDRYLVLKQLPTDNTYKLYVRQGLEGKDRLLVDPQNVKLAPQDQGKGKNVILYFSTSQNSHYVAVGIAPGGSERDTEIHIFETANGHALSDIIQRAWGGRPSWLPDNRSFIYGKLQKIPPGAPVTEIEQKFRAYLHVLGSDPAKDPAVFGFGVSPAIPVKATEFASAGTPPDSRYAIGAINSGVSPNSVFYIEPVSEMGKTNSAWRKVAGLSDDVADVDVHGDDLYALTFKNALRYKVVMTSALHPDLATAETIVPPSQAVVTGIDAASDALYVELMDGGISRLLRVPYGSKPKAQEVALPFKGTAMVQTDPRLPGALIGLTSWTKAYRFYDYDPKTNKTIATNLQPEGPYDNPVNLVSVEVKAKSYDGTMIPLSIIYPKGTKMDGSNPTWLRGYGSYGITITPDYTPMFLAWFDEGGVYAVCHARGGGAYGEEWHLQGKEKTKPNTWKDFIACAEYLVQHKYTSPAHLSGMGTSAGGITIGRAITSRPDLFGAAIDWVGMSDTVRSETSANGLPNVPEFGSVKSKAGFEALYAMSPYDHVKKGTAYPAVLLMTGANDPRVDPWQMDKMAARLQAATSSAKPILLRVDYHGGHNVIGATRADREDTFADLFSFLLWQLGKPGFQPSN
jgi:prolyl oligopeptidase